MKRDVAHLLLASTALAACEIALTLVRGRALFLSLPEQLLYAVCALSGLTACVLASGLGLRLAVGASAPARVLRIGAALASGALGARLFWLVSAGRRVRDLALRPYVVALLALALAALTLLVLERLARDRRDARARLMLPWLALAGALLCVSAFVLPRGYPAFHLGLELAAVFLAALAALAARAGSVPARLGHTVLAYAACALALTAPLALAHLAAHPTASFAVRESALLSARLMAIASPTHAATPTAHAHLAQPATPAHATIDLRDRDVLLVTVDALRADLLRAYGGTGKTPALDRLADEGAVFMRAYTPAPHTSYALSSLLTGKFVKPLVDLGHALGDPPTLPDRLRRYGYRTAAFYPPAIFFVDGARFASLSQRGFGFEYRKEMFASADARVAQLETYLAAATPHPLFVWMHLFEPHEPYDPPPDLAHDGSERGRYEAEVAACDRAVARLVETFRRARPRATVIVTADHGEEFGDHGGRFHGSSLYDEQVRVPLIWSSPGVVRPRHIEVPVELTDLGTTILSTAGIPRDAHMVGDDLSGALAGDDSAPRLAFASIEDRHMVTDGRLKAICGASEPHCALFDLLADPAERRNLGGARAREASALRRELDAFLASLSHREAVTVDEGVALPEALARAKLGIAGAGEALAPLLTDARPAVRAETARMLGELNVVRVLPDLERVREHDVAAEVRAEAAIAALTLGSDAAVDEVRALLREPTGSPDALAQQRRAASALAFAQHADGLSVLAALVRDESATEGERLRGVRALGALADPAGVPPLLEALSAVRLREAVASALGAIGGESAVEALRTQLVVERYPPARAAEAEALVKLRDPQAARLVQRMLGMESSLPGGVALLATLGALTPPSRAGALLTEPSVRTGTWRCHPRDCTPERAAQIVLPRRGSMAPGPLRVTLSYRDAEPGAVLIVDGVRVPLRTAEGQLSLERSSAASAARFAIAREGALSLVALAVTPARDELAPPAPEPWDAGVAPSDAAPSSDALSDAAASPAR